MGLSLTDEVNALKGYLARFYPEGLAEGQRKFVAVDGVRGAFVYAVLLLVYEISTGEHHRGVVVVCAVIMLVTTRETSRRIEKVVRAEMVFL